MGKTAVSIEDDVLAAGRQCAATRGISFSAWLTEAARLKARRENAEAYGRWLAGQTEAEKTETTDLDRIDNATRDAALSGTEW